MGASGRRVGVPPVVAVVLVAAFLSILLAKIVETTYICYI